MRIYWNLPVGRRQCVSGTTCIHFVGIDTRAKSIKSNVCQTRGGGSSIYRAAGGAVVYTHVQLVHLCTMRRSLRHRCWQSIKQRNILRDLSKEHARCRTQRGVLLDFFCVLVGKGSSSLHTQIHTKHQHQKWCVTSCISQLIINRTLVLSLYCRRCFHFEMCDICPLISCARSQRPENSNSTRQVQKKCV